MNIPLSISFLVLGLVAYSNAVGPTSDPYYDHHDPQVRHDPQGTYEPYEAQTYPDHVVSPTRDEYQNVPLNLKSQTFHDVRAYHDEPEARFESGPQIMSHDGSQSVPQENPGDTSDNRAGQKKIRKFKHIPKQMKKSGKKFYEEKAQPIIRTMKGEIGQIYQKTKNSKSVAGGLTKMKKAQGDVISKLIKPSRGKNQAHSKAGPLDEGVSGESPPVYNYRK